MAGVRWLEKELNWVEKYSSPIDFELLVKKLPNRTERAIQHKLLRLGFRSKRRDVFGSKIWTSQELALVEEKYSLVGAIGMLEFLPFRTQTAIQKKARELELNVDWEARVVGRRFGRLVVVSRAYKSKPTEGVPFGVWYYNCVCDCNNRVVTCINSLRSGSVSSCGCLRKETASKNGKLGLINLVGDRYGRGVVQNYNEEVSKEKGVPCWDLLCDCDSVYTARGASLKEGSTKSCGCLNKEKSRERLLGRTGKNHWNWKGGITEFSYSIRTCDKNLKWKKDCRERDNYTCRKCGKKGDSRFPVHHCRIPFWKMLEELVANGITDVKDIPDDSELWNTDNGIILCEDCHKEFHHIHGNDFTEEDFEKWLCSDIRKVV